MPEWESMTDYTPTHEDLEQADRLVMMLDEWGAGTVHMKARADDGHILAVESAVRVRPNLVIFMAISWDEDKDDVVLVKDAVAWHHDVADSNDDALKSFDNRSGES